MVLTALEKAGILIEALPYIRKFHGKTIVIKYGGHAMLNEELKKAVIEDVILMKLVGMHPIIVHGGGPEINEMLTRLGIKSSFVQGLRVTNEETMSIVEMVLAGKVNKEIVALVNHLGGKAVGFSGEDGKLIEAAKKKIKSAPEINGGEPIDLGFVGDVERINPGIVLTVTAQGFIPVIAPTGIGEDGKTYNINADYVAGELASALKADKLVLLTDVEGIFADYGDQNSLISSLKVEEVPALIEKEVIAGGMIPKVECCVNALKGGVAKTHIIDGRLPHSMLLEIFTDEGIGTEVVF